MQKQLVHACLNDQKKVYSEVSTDQERRNKADQILTLLALHKVSEAEKGVHGQNDDQLVE